MSVDNNNVNDQSNVTLEQQKQEISHGKQLLKQLKQGKLVYDNNIKKKECASL